MTITGFTIYSVHTKLCTATNARFEVLMLPKIQVFWDVKLSRLVNKLLLFRWNVVLSSTMSSYPMRLQTAALYTLAALYLAQTV